MREGVAALYREWVGMRSERVKMVESQKGGIRTTEVLEGCLVPQAVKNFFLQFPRLPCASPPRTSCPIFIPVFGLHPRSSWEETFLMNVRGLKGEKTKKRNGWVKRETKGIGAIRENIILFTSPSLFLSRHPRAPAKRNSQTFVGLKMSVGPSWLAISVFIHHHAMYCDSVAKVSFLILFYRFRNTIAHVSRSLANSRKNFQDIIIKVEDEKRQN